MTAEQLELLKYPIGKYNWPEYISEDQLYAWIEEIEELPEKLDRLVDGFTEEQFNTAYRPEGWTVKQVIHHLADSHINSFVRYKWTLTEDAPVIKAYHEERWAKLPDYEAPAKVSLVLLKALHLRWCILLRSLSAQDFDSIFIHPETGKRISLRSLTGMYAWHCKHHYAHIEHLAKRKGWV